MGLGAQMVGGVEQRGWMGHGFATAAMARPLSRPESSGRKRESERAGGRRMERTGGQGSVFLNRRSDVVSERGRGGEHGASWDATRHRAPVAGWPFKLFN